MLELITSIFNEAFFRPIINLLVILINVLAGIGIPGVLGFSIILLTIIIRMVVWPFMASQLKNAKMMAELKPKLDILKTKHQGDRQALSKAQMDLYKEHGINPAGGCLPALIQIPIVIALYNTISAFFNGPEGLLRINQSLYNPSWELRQIPDLNFFGLNLGILPSSFTQAGLAWLLFIPVITALLQFFQSKMMAPKPLKKYPSDSPKEKKEKAKNDDMASAMQTQMLYMMPVMVGYFAFQFPAGLALYWNTFTILGIIQQYLISGWGGAEGWMKKLNIVK